MPSTANNQQKSLGTRQESLWQRPYQQGQQATQQEESKKTTSPESRSSTQAKKTRKKARARVTTPKTDRPIQAGDGPARARATPSRSRNHNHTPLRLNNPQRILTPYQKAIYYSLLPTEHRIRTDHKVTSLSTIAQDYQQGNQDASYETIDYNAMSVNGESGSGLTTLLAQKALENYRDGKPCVILAHRDHMMDKIAQTIIDLVSQEERADLNNEIEYVNSNDPQQINQEKKIYIASTATLNNHLANYDDYKDFDSGGMNLAHIASNIVERSRDRGRLADLLPLSGIKDILIDEANRYTGPAKHGYSKIINSLLHETGSSPEDPTTLFGAAYTTYSRTPLLQARHGNNITNRGRVLEYGNYFPRESSKATPPPLELIPKYFKHPEIQTLEFQDTGPHADPIAQRLLNTDAPNLLLSDSDDSINGNIVSMIQAQIEQDPDHRIHILANSSEHARILCRMLNNASLRASVVTAEFTGHFNGTDRVRENTHNVINNYEYGHIAAERESNGYHNTNIIIDLDKHTPIHSSVTDSVYVLTLDMSHNRLYHYLGEAPLDHKSRSDAIEYNFINQLNAQEFNAIVQGLPIGNETVPKTNGGNGQRAQRQAEDVPVSSGTNTIANFDCHPLWRARALNRIVENRFPDTPFDQAIDTLSKSFNNCLEKPVSDESMSRIIRGLEVNHQIFRAFVNFIEDDLGQSLEQVAQYLPDLTGVKNESEAESIVRAVYDELSNHNNLAYGDDRNRDWLTVLDKALYISDYANPNERARLRTARFTKLIENNFGEEFFENRFSIRHAVQVFMGLETDPKLFGFLINRLSLDFEEMRTNFPHLTGRYREISFDRLQSMILEKYPDGPPLTDLREFFQHQVYDDLGIDFGTIVNSVIRYTRGSGQEVNPGSVKEQIYDFIKRYQEESTTLHLGLTGPLKPEQSQEIVIKASKNLNAITEEVIYNQLLAKLWDIDRKSILINDDLNYKSNADSIELSPSPFTSSFPYKAIDIQNCNPDWLLLTDEQLRASSTDDNLSIDLKSRLACSIANFLSSNPSSPGLNESSGDSHSLDEANKARTHRQHHETRLHPELEASPENKRLIQILTGAINPNFIKRTEQEKIRDYLEYTGLNLDEARLKFPALVGVFNQEEALELTRSVYQGAHENWSRDLIETQWNNHARIANDEDLLEPINDFLWSINPQIFLDTEVLTETIQLLSGLSPETNKQSMFRQFSLYLHKRWDSIYPSGSIEPLFPKLAGINNQDELAAAITCQISLGTLEQKKTGELKSPSQVLNYVDKTCDNLGLSRSELYNLAELNNPSSFYSEPIAGFEQILQTKPRFDDSVDLKQALANKQDEILAREFLRKFEHPLFSTRAQLGKYEWASQIIIPDPNKPSIKISITDDKVHCQEFSLEQVRTSGKKRKTTSQSKLVEELGYIYKNNEWQVDTDAPRLNEKQEIFFTALQKILASSSGNFALSLNKELRNLIYAYINEYKPDLLTDPDKNKLEYAIKTIVGDLNSFQKSSGSELNKRQEVFRHFVNFAKSKSNDAQYDLDRLIADHPQITGIRNLEEARLVAANPKYKFSAIEEPMDKISKISKIIGLSIEDLATLFNLPNLIDFYSEAIEKITAKMEVSTDASILSDIRRGLRDQQTETDLKPLHLHHMLWPDGPSGHHLPLELYRDDYSHIPPRVAEIFQFAFTKDTLQLNRVEPLLENSKILKLVQYDGYRYNGQSWDHEPLNDHALLVQNRLIQNSDIRIINETLVDQYHKLLLPNNEGDFKATRVSAAIAEYFETREPRIFNNEQRFDTELSRALGINPDGDLQACLDRYNDFIDFMVNEQGIASFAEVRESFPNPFGETTKNEQQQLLAQIKDLLSSQYESWDDFILDQHKQMTNLSEALETIANKIGKSADQIYEILDIPNGASLVKHYEGAKNALTTVVDAHGYITANHYNHLFQTLRDSNESLRAKAVFDLIYPNAVLNLKASNMSEDGVYRNTTHPQGAWIGIGANSCRFYTEYTEPKFDYQLNFNGSDWMIDIAENIKKL